MAEDEQSLAMTLRATANTLRRRPLPLVDLIPLLVMSADELDDQDKSFEIRHAADRRAIERWHAQYPGHELTLPDHADLCVWLLEELDKLQAKVQHGEPNRALPSSPHADEAGAAARAEATAEGSSAEQYVLMGVNGPAFLVLKCDGTLWVNPELKADEAAQQFLVALARAYPQWLSQ